MEIIKRYDDVDFCVAEEAHIDDNDKCVIRLKPVHGTVIYVTGAIKGDADSLMPFGCIDGEEFYRIAFYPDFLDFDKGWKAANGK